MDWTHVMTILAGNASLFLWATRQARSDYLHIDKKTEDNRKEIATIAENNRKETNDLIKILQDEFREFHLAMIKSNNKI